MGQRSACSSAQRAAGWCTERLQASWELTGEIGAVPAAGNCLVFDLSPGIVH